MGEQVNEEAAQGCRTRRSQNKSDQEGTTQGPKEGQFLVHGTYQRLRAKPSREIATQTGQRRNTPPAHYPRLEGGIWAKQETFAGRRPNNANRQFETLLQLGLSLGGEG